MQVDPIIRQDILGVLAILAEREYETLAAMTHNTRLTATELRTAVESYGRTLVRPPDDELPPDLELIEVDGGPPRKVFAVMSLWTEEEGQSDLSLEMMLIEVAPGLWTDEIHNIHVL